jgi:hypothetical protein
VFRVKFAAANLGLKSRDRAKFAAANLLGRPPPGSSKTIPRRPVIPAFVATGAMEFMPVHQSGIGDAKEGSAMRLLN